MTKATYQGFKNIDNDFNQKYSKTFKAFQNRIGDLRNKGKYPNDEDYIGVLTQKGFW